MIVLASVICKIPFSASALKCLWQFYHTVVLLQLKGARKSYKLNNVCLKSLLFLLSITCCLDWPVFLFFLSLQFYPTGLFAMSSQSSRALKSCECGKRGKVRMDCLKTVGRRPLGFRKKVWYKNIKSKGYNGDLSLDLRGRFCKDLIRWWENGSYWEK